MVLVTPDPVKTVSSNSLLSKLLTGGASYSHGSWTKADCTWAAYSSKEGSVSLTQCFPRGEEDKSSPGKHPIPCSVLKHKDAYSLQLLLEKELSRPWDLGRAIPPFSGSLSQEGPEATCNSSLLPFYILKGMDFSNLFPSSLKENHGFQGKPCCLNSVHWLLQSSSQVWIQVGRISEERVHWCNIHRQQI